MDFILRQRRSRTAIAYILRRRKALAGRRYLKKAFSRRGKRWFGSTLGRAAEVPVFCFVWAAGERRERRQRPRTAEDVLKDIDYLIFKKAKAPVPRPIILFLRRQRRLAPSIRLRFKIPKATGCLWPLSYSHIHPVGSSCPN